MKIATKLAVLIALFVIGMLVLASYTYVQTVRTTEQLSIDKLSAVREGKGWQLERYLGFINDQVVTLSEAYGTKDALREFAAGYRSYLDDAAATGGATPPATAATELTRFVAERFVPLYNRAAAVPRTAEHFAPDDPVAVALQLAYIARNSADWGSKSNLVTAGDASAYNTAHVRHHPVFRSYQRRFGYYDLFLIDAATQSIVYSVEKEIDFATNLASGPFAATGFARAVRQALATTNPSVVFRAEFEPYAPSMDAPAAFVVSPIVDGGVTIGALALQMPIEELNRIATGDRNWEYEGLGATGESYIIGGDLRMRSVSRKLIEDREALLTDLRRAGVLAPVIASIERTGTTALQLQVPADDRLDAVTGATGTFTGVNYRGREAIVSFRPLYEVGWNWIVISEMETAEAFAPARTLALGMAIALAGTLLVVIAASIAIAWSIRRPLRVASDRLAQIAAGGGDLTAELRVATRDEVGELATHFNRFLGRLRDIVSEIKRAADATIVVGEALSANSAESSAAITEISANIESMTNQVRNLDAEITNAAEATTSIARNISVLAESVENQGASVNQSSAAIEQISVSIQNVARTAQERRQATARAAERAGEGTSRIQETVQIMHSLSRSAEEMLESTRIINQIAGQTNLLAMNAAIEAAHAGDAGRGFAVVADEIRKLAESTNENAKLIGSTLKTTADQIADALRSTEASESVMQEVGQQVGELSSVFLEIANGMDELSQSSQEILAATSSLTAVTSQVQDAFGGIEESSGTITTALDRVREVSSSVASGMAEIRAGSAEIQKAAEEVAQLGENNRSSIRHITEQVDHFTVD